MNLSLKRAAALFLAPAFFFLSCGLSEAAKKNEAKAASTDSIKVHGDSVEYFHEQQKVIGTGHVRIDYEDTALTADKITVYMATKVAVAEGHVVLKQKGNTFRGERGEYNFDTKVGNVAGMAAEIEPSLYGKAKKIERVSPDHYRATDGYVTTCCGDSPFYRIQSQSVDLYPGRKVVIRNALIFIKNVPVFFVPIFVQPLVDFDRFPVQVVPGKTREWGAFVLTKWRYELLETPEMVSRGNVLIDWREKRGFGYGVDNYYKGKDLGRGAIRTYYTEDGEPPSEVQDPDRYRVQWRHQMKIAEDTTFTTEINKLSDPLIIKDFFYREEYERDVFPDNYVSVVHASPEYTLSLLERDRLDSFFTVVERSPEIRFDTHNRQFENTPFYLREEVQFSNLRKEFADSKTQLDVTRLETNHTLSYAARAGVFSVTPRVGTHQTYYSRQVDDPSDAVRGTFDPGLDVSTRFYKIYDVSVHALGLDWNRLRHIFSPTMSYNFRPNPTVLRGKLQPFDSIDALDKQNFVRFQFENKLQTKEGGRLKKELGTREIARFLPFFDMDFDTQHIENTGYEAEFRPYPWLAFDSDGTYNTRTGKFDTANFDVGMTRRAVRFSVGQRYLRDQSSQATVDVRWQVNRDWALKTYERYEFTEKKSKEFEVTVSKAFSCVIVDFTYNHSQGDTFYVMFRLKGYPDVSFNLSQSYNSPRTSQASNQVFS